MGWDVLNREGAKDAKRGRGINKDLFSRLLRVLRAFAVQSFPL